MVFLIGFQVLPSHDSNSVISQYNRFHTAGKHRGGRSKVAWHIFLRHIGKVGKGAWFPHEPYTLRLICVGELRRLKDVAKARCTGQHKLSSTMG